MALVPEAASEQFKHFELPIRKFIHGRTHAAFDGLNGLEDKAFAELRADVDFSLEHFPQRREHVGQGLGFHDVAERTGPERAKSVE